jgi:hypothetical protein
MSNLGLLGQLPLELRENIYNVICDQIIHWCCSPEKHVPKSTPVAAEPPGFLPQDAVDFHWNCCVECSQHDHRPLLRNAKWCSTTFRTGLRLRTSDVLSLLLTCKDMWHEVEPTFWKTATLSLGLAQFDAFHHKCLLLPLRSTKPQVPRHKALKKLHISIPQLASLANEIGRDSRSHGLSGHFLADNACFTSSKTLLQYSSLENLDITVSVDDSSAFLPTEPFYALISSLTSNLQPVANVEIYYAERRSNLEPQRLLKRSQLFNPRDLRSGVLNNIEHTSSRYAAALGKAAKDMLKGRPAPPPLSDGDDLPYWVPWDSQKDGLSEVWGHPQSWSEFIRRFEIHLSALEKGSRCGLDNCRDTAIVSPHPHLTARPEA